MRTSQAFGCLKQLLINSISFLALIGEANVTEKVLVACGEAENKNLDIKNLKLMFARLCLEGPS